LLVNWHLAGPIIMTIHNKTTTLLGVQVSRTLGFLLTDKWTSHTLMAPLVPSLLRFPPTRLFTYSTKAGVNTILVPEITRGTSVARASLVDESTTRDDIGNGAWTKPDVRPVNPNKQRMGEIFIVALGSS
jgi:hypothetical protein